MINIKKEQENLLKKTNMQQSCKLLKKNLNKNKKIEKYKNTSIKYKNAIQNIQIINI